MLAKTVSLIGKFRRLSQGCFESRNVFAMVLVVDLPLARKSQLMSQLADYRSLRCGMVTGIQYFEFKCRFLFECCAQGSGETKLRGITHCCVEECVVTHRIYTTDLVP